MIQSAQTLNLDSTVFEEMSDADAMAVAGGSATGAAKTLVTGVTGVVGSFGNQGTPTTGAVKVVTTTTQATTDYLNGVNHGLETGLFQPTNETVGNVGEEVAGSV